MAQVCPQLSLEYILRELYYPRGRQLMHWHRRNLWNLETVAKRPPEAAVKLDDAAAMLAQWGGK